MMREQLPMDLHHIAARPEVATKPILEWLSNCVITHIYPPWLIWFHEDLRCLRSAQLPPSQSLPRVSLTSEFICAVEDAQYNIASNCSDL